MYPDWVIGLKMIELFGAEHYPGYLDKIEVKKTTGKMKLIAISRSEFEQEKWQKIILTNIKS
jgi:cyclopropane fatty-acyl-phospholipid synthase-like methyltransferase